MSVIGRLDGQVEEALIKPVGESGRTAGAIPADRADTSERPAADDTGATAEVDSDQSARGDERDRGPNALPVWLL